MILQDFKWGSNNLQLPNPACSFKTRLQRKRPLEKVKTWKKIYFCMPFNIFQKNKKTTQLSQTFAYFSLSWSVVIIKFLKFCSICFKIFLQKNFYFLEKLFAKQNFHQKVEISIFWKNFPPKQWSLVENSPKKLSKIFRVKLQLCFKFFYQ